MPKIYGMDCTDHLTRHTAENICHAFDFAKYIGMPLNRYVVINLDERLSDRGATTIFSHIREKFRNWLSNAYKKHGLEPPSPAYVYVHENPDGICHVNWVVHVPEHLQAEFDRKLPGWIRKAKRELGDFDYKAQSVNPHRDKCLAKYIIKGIDEAYIAYLHLQEVAAPQGRIFGRRATASPSIGRTARREAGFIPRRDRHKWKQRLAA